MRYIEFAEVFEQLSSTNSRLEKTAILAAFLRSLPNEVIDECILLLQGRVYPEWEDKTVGLAGKLVLKAVSRATGYSESEVAKQFEEMGDIGLTAYNLIDKKKQQTLFSSPLELHNVFTTLQKMAGIEGTGSQDIKLAELSKLLTSAKPLEAKFLVRTVVEDLRVGIASGTFRDAIAFAFFTDGVLYDSVKNSLDYQTNNNLEQVKLDVKRAFDLTADFTYVIKHIKSGKSLDEIQLKPGSPCKVMLARKEKTFSEAFARTGFPVRLEYKYDGFRLQIHKDGNDVKLFTRRLENVSNQFPDVVKAVREQVTAIRCIIDSEAVGYDPKTGKYQPFQHISKRIRRKYDIQALVDELPVELNIFDILLLEGTVLIDEPFTTRLPKLTRIIKEKKGVAVLAKGIEINSETEAEEFYQESLSAGNEGVMIKNLAGLYQPGGRVSAWIKMKPIMDELDLVIVAAEWGNGKRSAWLTSFTLACRNESGDFYEIGRVGTGLKEEESEDAVSFPQLTKLLEPLIIAKKGKEVRVQPQVVIMLAYEEIQKSPTYTSGYALRFPRVLALRPDRSTADIASYDDILDLYGSQ